MKKRIFWSFIFKIYFSVIYSFCIETEFEMKTSSELKLQMFNFVEKKSVLCKCFPLFPCQNSLFCFVSVLLGD